MECVKGALKGSILKEISFSQKLNPQAVVEESWNVNMQNAASCDDFFVDDLLDFSNLQQNEREEESEQEIEERNQQQKTSAFVSVSLKQETPHEDFKQGSEFHTLLESLPSSDVPEDDLASLEWLSHFVEDSNSEYSAPFLDRVLTEKPKFEKSQLEPAAEEEKPVFKTPVPAKARSKRTRTGVRVWPVGSPETSSSSSSSCSSTSSTTTFTSASSSPWLICTNRVFHSEPVEPVFFRKPVVKKQRKKPALESEPPCSGGGNGQPPRRCSHCGVQKTPQWRTGPMGAKTLCNACGVRFKSGRLFPEYRPACSPTFSSELHSNHHRKVLEMRKRKELLGQAEPGLVQSVVPSF